MSVYLTVLKPGDTVLGMNLAHGGHLTHGHPLNFSGKYYRIVPCGVSEESDRINYSGLGSPERQNKQKLIVVGPGAYPRTIDLDRTGHTAREVGALALADIAHIAGLVGTGIHPSPLP